MAAEDWFTDAWLTAVALLEADPDDQPAINAILGDDLGPRIVYVLPGILKQIFDVLARESDPELVARVLYAVRQRALAGGFTQPR
jgi:hypothetical protein